MDKKELTRHIVKKIMKVDLEKQLEATKLVQEHSLAPKDEQPKILDKLCEILDLDVEWNAEIEEYEWRK